MKTRRSTVMMETNAFGFSMRSARAVPDDASEAHVISNELLHASRDATLSRHRDSSATSYSDRADLQRTRHRDSIPNMQAGDREVMTGTPTPNHALQRTATLAFSYRCAAVTSTGSVTACAPAAKPSTRRAFASRRFAHPPAPGSRSLSLGSLGVFTLSEK